MFALVVAGPGTVSGGERYAFLVAAREYDKTQLNSLSYSENDAIRLAEVLRRCGYRNEDIVLMTQTLGAKQTRYLPLADKIRRELSLLLRQVREGDSVVVAFSGHGVQFAGEEDLYYCAADANLTNRSTLISLSEIYRALEACPAQVKLLLVDACRNDPLSRLAKSRRVVELETLDRVRPRHPPGGIAALFSCSQGEQSFEHPDLEQGIFFHYVARGLEGAADLNGDLQVSLPELEQYAVGEVQRFARVELGASQTPERKGNARGLVVLSHVTRPSLSPLPVAPKVGEVIENSLGMKLAYIPAGVFLMGSSAEQVAEAVRIEASASPSNEFSAGGEQPLHRVRITQPFYMGVYEVTRNEFAQFVQQSGYVTEPERNGKGGHGWANGKFQRNKPEYSWRHTGFHQDGEHPVVNVTWNDAVAFCQWLSEKENRQYRLPTEAEWEYACRGGTQTIYQHGNNPEQLALVGNVADGTLRQQFPKWPGIQAVDGFAFTAPVGRFRGNAFGLFDMHGNVWEWCSDKFDIDYYRSSPASDPQGPDQGDGRVYRGGGWNNTPGYCRSADRSWSDQWSCSDSVGFRVLLVPEK